MDKWMDGRMHACMMDGYKCMNLKLADVTWNMTSFEEVNSFDRRKGKNQSGHECETDWVKMAPVSLSLLGFISPSEEKHQVNSSQKQSRNKTGKLTQSLPQWSGLQSQLLRRLKQEDSKVKVFLVHNRSSRQGWVAL